MNTMAQWSSAGIEFKTSFYRITGGTVLYPGVEVIKLFSCSAQLGTKIILLINVKMPTIVGILTLISMINTTSERIY